MGKIAKALAVVVLSTPGLISLVGCGRQVVFVEEGNPIRLGSDVTGHVFYLDPDTGEWTRSEDSVNLPAGWYSVSPGDAGDG